MSDTKKQHAFIRPKAGTILNVAHIRGAFLGETCMGETNIWFYMTSGKEFTVKYTNHGEAKEAFEKLWDELEHLLLPLER